MNLAIAWSSIVIPLVLGERLSRRTMDTRRRLVIGHPTDWGPKIRDETPSTAAGVGRHGDACYTPALTAMTGKSSDGTAPERARDGASRAGRTT